MIRVVPLPVVVHIPHAAVYAYVFIVMLGVGVFKHTAVSGVCKPYNRKFIQPKLPVGMNFQTAAYFIKSLWRGQIYTAFPPSSSIA